MRINKFLAAATDLSRRAADTAVGDGRVFIDGVRAAAGDDVQPDQEVRLDGAIATLPIEDSTILLHKPVGYVVSRNGQGSRTVFELLPPNLQRCQAVGRLDKDSSGLLILTTDGQLAEQLTHPRYAKRKRYEIRLDRSLQPLHRQLIAERGVLLDDGISQLGLERLIDGNDRDWVVIMHEGRNRQIRRTFSALGYIVIALHRTDFGEYTLSDLTSGNFRIC